MTASVPMDAMNKSPLPYVLASAGACIAISCWATFVAIFLIWDNQQPPDVQMRQVWRLSMWLIASGGVGVAVAVIGGILFSRD